ncbi:MAG: response regulator, partial [Selenomonadaceae bacterium]|nr:response regulator [Selenomonadaceae bacterium]
MNENAVSMTDGHDGNDAHRNFISVISQINNIACLLVQHGDGSFSAEYATPSFIKLMECDTQDDALELMTGEKLFEYTFPEDRQVLRETLTKRVSADGTPDTVVRRITGKGNMIWCSLHYAFIDHNESHYVYATFTDVTLLMRYEEQLQSVYTSLGESFHKTDDDSLARVRANLTGNIIEEANGASYYVFGDMQLTFSEALEQRASYFPITEERQLFLDTFGIEPLTKSYMDGVVSVSKVLYSRLPNDSVFYVKITANVTRHPMSGNLIAFITEESNNPEKLASTINGKILGKQFDLVAYIARDIYDVAIGDAGMIEHGNIFPRVKHGSYSEYLETQIIPALSDDKDYRQRIRKAMDLKTVFEMFKVKEPYSVDIEVDMEDGHFYKRFDFYSVDPESEYCIVLKTDTTAVRLEQLEQEERKRELEYSRQELADTDGIMADAGFGMWHMTLEEGKASRLRANDKMKDLLGIVGKDLTEEEIYDAWYSHVPEEEKPEVKKRIDEMLSGKLSECINLWIHPDGREMYTRFGGTVVADEDGRQSLRGYYSDVTESVREDRAQRDALADALMTAEHANRAKTTFLNNMSHDIRTPMNAIVGFTALATSHIDNKEQVRDYLGKITVSSQHLLSLINDVLDMSRIESGKMTLDETEIHLPDLIHDLRTIIHANIKAKQLNFNIDIADVVNEDIIADKLRLNQIFLNILSNAIKFTPNGGSVSFLVTEKPSPIPEHAVFEFRIKDTGIGMSREFQKTIFEAFTREKTSTVSGIQGTGLGMAISKSIVDMMGGTISVASEKGKGTEFIITIPCRILGDPVRNEKISELQGIRALVVDDDTDACLSVSSMLRAIGMRSEWVCSGKEAIVRTKEAVKQAVAFNAYIVDWQMPDMNGIEVVRRIRSLASGTAPIIIMSAYDWGEIEEEAKDAGVTSICSKPIFLSELHHVLAAPFQARIEENAPKEKPVNFAGKKILLAEDNEMNQMIAEAILTEAGLQIDIAGNGEEAVTKTQNGLPPDTLFK